LSGRAANAGDYRALAKARLPHFLFEYLDGGSYDEVTLRRNVEDLRSVAHPYRQGCRVVEHDIPFAIFQSIEFAIAIADELLHFRWQLVRMSFAAIESCDLVAAAERVTNLIGTGEPRPTQDQNVQWFHRFLGQQRYRSYARGKCGGGGHFDKLAAGGGGVHIEVRV